tara:strand:+ start:318 stop:1175 length:858 start_codon:yes stop_codon:yes gene_type:complete
MRKQFRDTLSKLNNDDIVLILGDVSVYLFNQYAEQNSDKVYNLAIGENSLVSVSAGLSSQGLIPFVHTINPFLSDRSYEQIKLDMCYNQYGGNIVTCGATFDYAFDGVSHHCYSDIANLRLLPNIEVLQPGSDKEVDVLIRSQYDNGKTTYYRLSDFPHNIDMDVEFGKGVDLINKYSNTTVMTSGPILQNVYNAVKDLDVNLVYFHTIKPIDKDIIQKYSQTKICVFQDVNGLHEAITEVEGLNIKKFGVKDDFYTEYGSVHDARKHYGLDIKNIEKTIRNELK